MPATHLQAQIDAASQVGLRVSLLGPFHATAALAGSVVGEGERVQRLLAYLLLHRGRPRSRQTVGRLLWPSVGPDQQRKRLRQALWKLQSNVLGPDNTALMADSGYLLLDLGPELWLDLAEFETACAAASDMRGTAMSDVAAERLTHAANLYRGELLQGWNDGWCLSERLRLAGLQLAMLNKLSAWCAATGRLEQGLALGRRALVQDPANERAHRHLMRLLALTGDRNAALAQYDLCTGELRRAFDVQPEQRTQELLAAIRKGDNFMATPRQIEPLTPDGPQALDLAAELQQIRYRLDALHLDADTEDVGAGHLGVGAVGAATGRDLIHAGDDLSAIGEIRPAVRQGSGRRGVLWLRETCDVRGRHERQQS